MARVPLVFGGGMMSLTGKLRGTRVPTGELPMDERDRAWAVWREILTT